MTHGVRGRVDLQKMNLINSLYGYWGMGSPLWSSAEETERRKTPTQVVNDELSRKTDDRIK